MPTSTRLTNRPKSSADDDAEALGPLAPEQDAIAAPAPDEADEAQAADRHPLAAPAERLGHQAGDAGQRHADDRDDAAQGRADDGHDAHLRPPLIAPPWRPEARDGA